MTTNDRGPPTLIEDVSDFCWSIEREADGNYGLYEPYGLRAAQIYWDSRGRCWADWVSPHDGEGVRFFSPVYAHHLERLARILASTSKPHDVECTDPA